ncbi:nucleolar protein 11-like [Pseudochaenichthys georgianus]|uniref:nucleolar protein 11-like n=1 Tax=Pseudochaenichthys georgianus TaxID=52239 RepID=UPI00146D6252|nr:nucleolar protein 11-like [Pseudochaenichthys georgianus]
MAALYEGYTLCGLTPSQNLSNSGIQGVEPERDSDHVVVTDSRRSVTLFKVSDQKSLSSWTVKQGQTLTCSAVYNSKTKEYVAVADSKVIRIWKEEDIHLDKAFKATVSSDIWRVHSAAELEPVVLFQRGAVRFLDSLLSAPKQPIEDVLAQEEAIRWSTNVLTESQQLVIFTTEQKGDNFLYLQRFNPNTLQKYRLEREEPGLSPLSFSASYKDKHIRLVYLYPNGHVYQSIVPVRGLGADEGAPALPLPRSLLLALPVGEGLLEAASAQVLDEAHVAVVGLPHPSAGAGKDFLCIWNTNFQTLQAGKEMKGKIYGQLWGYSNKLFIPHGKSFSVIPYECPKSSLASALGKLRQTKTEESKASTSVPSWNNILHEDKANPSKTVETRKTRTTRKSQSAPSLTNDQIMEFIKTASVAEVQKEVEGLLSRTDVQDLQPSLGQLAAALVSRSLGEEAFYTPSILAQLVQTRCLCHSMCPDLVLLALEKKDYFLCQLCLQFFPDIPEAVTCACLKTFISMPDSDAEKVNLEPESISLMETLMAGERDPVGLQNGFSPATNDMDQAGGTEAEKKETTTPPEHICPVGLHKGVLLNEVLMTAYSDFFLLPHLKDLSPQHVVLFLRYLQFLYLKYSQDAFPQMHGLRSPTLTQIMDWVCLLLDAHFTVLAMTPEAKGLLHNLHTFVKSQVRLFSELGKIEGSLHELNKMKVNKDIGQYSIEVIELF